MLYILLVILSFNFTCTYCILNNVCFSYEDYANIQNNLNCTYDIAAEGTTDEIIRYYNYSLEKHEVITPDGYILIIFRIPNHSVNGTKGDPVLLVHALQTSSSAYLALRENSLAFVLADAGYDVWLINFRGNEYSHRHVNMTRGDPKFWNFSVDDYSLIDIPSVVDYMANITHKKGRIIYIGHSLGTTTAFMYASALPKHATENLKIIIALAPAYSLIHTRSLLARAYNPFVRLNALMVELGGFHRYVYNTALMRALPKLVCFQSPAFLRACMELTNLFLLGPQSDAAPRSIPVMFRINLAGTSYKVIVQESDLVNTKLRHFDYGPVENMRVYGSSEAPLYDISKIKVPIFNIFSSGDWTNSKQDAVLFYKALMPVAKKYGYHKVKTSAFNHGDYVFGEHAKTLVYDVILSLLNKLASSI